MSEYKFSCPHCDQHIVYDETCFGQSVHCPSCQQVITVPTGLAAAPPRLGLRVSAQAPRPDPGPAVAAQSQPQPQFDRPNSSLAVASLVLSLLSLLLGPLGYIPGIICGHLARARLRRNAWLRGAGFAKAGLIIGYLGLTLTIAFVGLTVLGMYQAIRASAVQINPSNASGVTEAAGASETVPAVTGPAPVSVKVQNFRPKAAGKKGGFTLLIENRARKPVARLLLRMEYRDADGVKEDDSPYTILQSFPPNVPIKVEKDDFFMLPTTRSVTVSVREVTFVDGSEWSQLKAALAAAAPGPLSFAGQAVPDSAEVIRFRPNQAKKGNVASRFVNHSNKAIQAFSLDMICLDATGKKVDTVRAGWSFGSPDLMIGPGEAFEFSRDVPGMNEAARSATFVVRELTFAGGEKWVPTKK